MKICPKCGYLDRSHWRQNRWRTNVEFLTYLSYSEDIETEILEKLKRGCSIVCDKNHAYRLSGRVVERILKVDYIVGGAKAFHIPREKPRTMDPFQKILIKKEAPKR